MNRTESAECEVIGKMQTKNEHQVLNDTTQKKIVGIYGLRNKITGKWYIGQSIDVVKRFSDYKHLRCLSQKKIHRAIKKYGYENFEKVILEECVNLMLNSREEYWTLYYDSIKNGYNIRLGGRSPMFGRQHTEEFKEHISKKMKGRKYSEESIKKMSIAAKGKRHTLETKEKLKNAWKKRKINGNIITEEGRNKISKANMGHTVSEETRKKISAANKGRRRTEEQRLKMSESQRKRFSASKNIIDNERVQSTI